MSDAEIRELLARAKTIAVVGLSDRPWRPSYGVSAYMQKAGYRIVPVNPTVRETLGEASFSTLEDVPVPIDIVNVFRRSEFAAGVVESAIAVSAKCVWMQEGVVDVSAANRARDAGLAVAMDLCILKEHQRLLHRR